MHQRTSLLVGFLATLLLTGAGCINLGSGGAVPNGPMGMFRSIDKGETWQQINTIPTAEGLKSLAGLRTYRLYTDPSDANALYVGTRGQGLFYSYDKGLTWHFVDALKNMYVYALAVDPRSKCTIFVSDGRSVYKTTDCTRTWQLLLTEARTVEHVVSLAVDYTNSNTIYVGMVGGDVLQSTDGGIGWRTIKNFSTPIQAVVTDPMTPGRVYVASTQNGLFRSDDSGFSWFSSSTSFRPYNSSKQFYRLLLHPTQRNALYWVSKYGILFSSDAGFSWKDMKLITPPGSVNIYALAINPLNPLEMYYTGTVYGENNSNRSTFYKSTDGGQNWVTKKLPTNTIPVAAVIHPTDGILFMTFTVPEQQ